MRAKYVGNRPDRIIMNVQNTEATAIIRRGTPVVLNVSSTSSNDDGMDVVLPATAGNASSFAYRFGVVTQDLNPNDFGEAVLFGPAQYALVTRMTRAASTDSWTSSASLADKVALGLDTLNNAFLIGASAAGSLGTVQAMAVLMDSLASAAASATATSDTRTAIVTGARVFVRML